MTTILARIARPLELILGLVFLLGVVLKLEDIDRFATQILSYGVLPSKALLGPAALVALGAECFLGMAFAAGLRPVKATHLAMALLLLVFTGLILYGWIVNDLEDCGCFGAMEMNPPVSIAKNLLFLLMTALSWHGLTRPAGEAAPRRFRAARFAAAILVSIAAEGYALANLSDFQDEGAEGQFAQFVLDTGEGTVDLGEGEHLVAVLSMDCEHCLASVPELNSLFLDMNLPRLVALCYEPNEGDYGTFVSIAAPLFPMHNLGPAHALFASLIDAWPPRVWYVRDGNPERFWDEEQITHETISTDIQALRSAPAS